MKCKKAISKRWFKESSTIYVEKTKALISCTVSSQLICVFALEYDKIGFFHKAAQMSSVMGKL